MKIVKVMNYSVWKLIFGRGGILPGPWRMGRALVKREQGGEHYRFTHRARMKWKLQCIIWRKLNFWKRTGNTIDQVDRGQFARYILFTRRYWSVTNCCSHANKNSNVISFPVWLKCPISEAVISNIRCMAFLFALQCNILVQKEKMKKKFLSYVNMMDICPRLIKFCDDPNTPLLGIIITAVVQNTFAV